MKKKFLLLPLIGGFLLTGCKFTLFGHTISLFEKDEKKDTSGDQSKPGGDGDGGEIIPDDPTQHATSMSIDPNAPFYLKVGETRTISVSLSPAPELAEEKINSWYKNNSHINFVVKEGATNKVDVTGVSAGTTVLTAINVYNELLTKSVTIKVIDFDDKDYLWQFSSEDRAQFGYVKDEAPVGTAYGVANLNGISWSYSREKQNPDSQEEDLIPYTSSLQTSMGAVGFGKGGDPETHLHFETESALVVNDFVIEAASAHSLAKMTIKVGGEVYLNEQIVPRAERDVIGTIKTEEHTEKRSGKIEIDVVTPEYDVDEAGTNPEYVVPGAFYLKSILIHFGEEPAIKTEEKFDFKAMYDDPEDGIFDNLSKSSAKEVKISRNDFDVTLEKVKKEDTSDEKIPGYAHSNGYIDIKLNKSDEIIYKVEFQVQYGTTGDSYKTVYSLECSKSCGAPFTKLNVSGDKTTGLLKVGIIRDNINTIRLTPSKTNNIGLDYLTISTREGVNPTVKSIDLPEVFEPINKNYNAGDLFDPSGLKDLIISYNETGVEPDALPASELEWFDGVSYDLDSEKAVKELAAGTTYVYGVFRGEAVAKVEGLTVTGEFINLTLVKDASDIDANDKYLLVGKYSAGFSCLNGAGTSSTAIIEGASLSGFELSDSVSVPIKAGTYYFTASFDTNEKLLFENSNGNKVGLKNNGDLNCTKSPDLVAWDYQIDEQNRLIMSMLDAEASPKTKYLGVNNTSGKFSAYGQAFKSTQGEIYLYRIAE